MGFWDIFRKSICSYEINKNKELQKTIEDLELKIEALEKIVSPFHGLPTMEELIDTDRAVIETIGNFQKQWKKQFQLELDSNPYSSELGVTKTRWSREGESVTRIDREMFKKLLDISYIAYYPRRGKLTHGRWHVCGDFGKRFEGFINSSEYWDTCMGSVRVPKLPSGHWLNFVWFKGEEKIFMVEPQNASIFLVERPVLSPNGTIENGMNYLWSNYKPLEIIL